MATTKKPAAKKAAAPKKPAAKKAAPDPAEAAKREKEAAIAKAEADAAELEAATVHTNERMSVEVTTDHMKVGSPVDHVVPEAALATGRLADRDDPRR